MVALNGLLAQSPVVVAPLPAQSTLDLLASYGVPYPGNAVPAPSLELIRMAETWTPDTTIETITAYLTEVYPKLRPNSYTSVGLSFASTVTADPNTQSNIYNFYAISNNCAEDILPPGTAKPLNAAITDLERTYSQYALMFIMDLFDKHLEDTSDNPHHDSGENLANVWDDFFQTLYNKYTSLVNNPVDLESFILDKTTPRDIATVDGYMLSDQLLYIVPYAVINAMLAAHNNATNGSIHPILQAALTAEITIPIPSLYFDPTLFCYRYAMSPSAGSVITDTMTPTQKINYFLGQFAMLGNVPIHESEILQIGTPYYGSYYVASPLNGSFPRMNGTLFVKASVDITDLNTVNILTLSSSTTTDSLIIVKIGGEQNNYQINFVLDGILYENPLYTTSDNVIFFLVYTPSGITIEYLDQDGTEQTQTRAFENLVFDFDTIQVGVPVSYPNNISPNTIQLLEVFPDVLSSVQMSLLFNTTLS